MTVSDEIKAQTAKVRQELTKLLELLDKVEAPAAKKTAAPKK